MKKLIIGLSAATFIGILVGCSDGDSQVQSKEKATKPKTETVYDKNGDQFEVIKSGNKLYDAIHNSALVSASIVEDFNYEEKKEMIDVLVTYLNGAVEVAEGTRERHIKEILKDSAYEVETAVKEKNPDLRDILAQVNSALQNLDSAYNPLTQKYDDAGKINAASMDTNIIHYTEFDTLRDYVNHTYKGLKSGKRTIEDEIYPALSYTNFFEDTIKVDGLQEEFHMYQTLAHNAMNEWHGKGEVSDETEEAFREQLELIYLELGLDSKS
ncbi:hypothetical protein ACFOZY_12115 [Chungangia koreensis]|uniref:Lipoprotein n=1 Tax=Chungangia koreensis TaxID=752657 RepID=A0ABV8X6Z1_9LACT